MFQEQFSAALTLNARIMQQVLARFVIVFGYILQYIILVCMQQQALLSAQSFESNGLIVS